MILCPQGYVVDHETPEVDRTLVGRLIVYKWTNPALWYVGKVTQMMKKKDHLFELYYADYARS